MTPILLKALGIQGGHLSTGFVRAQTIAILAMSLDGKIADRDRAAARFSSATDLHHLETQIAQVDAVLFGAGTLRAYGTCLSIRDPDLRAQRRQRQKPEQPIQIVCSASGAIDPTLPFFQQPVPRWLLTTPAGAQAWTAGAHFERVCPQISVPMDWKAWVMALEGEGIRRLALLGGGTLMAAFAEQDLIDEWCLTLCPLVLGGTTAPTPVEGTGWPTALAPQFTLVNVQAIENEVFLHYRRCQLRPD